MLEIINEYPVLTVIAPTRPALASLRETPVQLNIILQDSDDPLALSDNEIIVRAAAFYDRPLPEFDGLQVRRPENNSIIIMEKPEYGYGQ